jgi:hypothetical protein
MNRHALIFSVLVSGAIAAPYPSLAAHYEDPAANSLGADTSRATVGGSIEPFIGKWKGPWRLGMSSGSMLLVLSADPKNPGTVQITNIAKFGAEPEPLTNVVVKGKYLDIKANGADSGPLKIMLELGDSGQNVRGTMTYDGFSQWFLLKRVQ